MPFESIEYDREKAVAYAHRWAMGRNPAYYDFQEIGGDCTNFASQCIFAGAGVMNYTPLYGWYYISASDRTASWTGVEYLYNFLIGNRGAGPYAESVRREELAPGDIVQLGSPNGVFYHSPVVVAVTGNGLDGILVAAHTEDSDWRPLSTYRPARVRY